MVYACFGTEEMLAILEGSIGRLRKLSLHNPCRGYTCLSLFFEPVYR